MEADWYPDPLRRHDRRYYDGRSWTDRVADGAEMRRDAEKVEPIRAPISPPRHAAVADGEKKASLMAAFGVVIMLAAVVVTVWLGADLSRGDLEISTAEKLDLALRGLTPFAIGAVVTAIGSRR